MAEATHDQRARAATHVLGAFRAAGQLERGLRLPCRALEGQLRIEWRPFKARLGDALMRPRHPRRRLGPSSLLDYVVEAEVRIRFNSASWGSLTPQAQDETAVHEAAHLLVGLDQLRLNKRLAPHGPQWRRWMERLGYPAARASAREDEYEDHVTDADRERQGWAPVWCACGPTTLGPQRTAKVARGETRYTCRVCRAPVAFRPYVGANRRRAVPSAGHPVALLHTWEPEAFAKSAWRTGGLGPLETQARVLRLDRWLRERNLAPADDGW